MFLPTVCLLFVTGLFRSLKARQGWNRNKEQDGNMEAYCNGHLIAYFFLFFTVAFVIKHIVCLFCYLAYSFETQRFIKRAF